MGATSEGAVPATFCVEPPHAAVVAASSTKAVHPILRAIVDSNEWDVVMVALRGNGCTRTKLLIPWSCAN
jgi:hypothetical protein